MISLRFEKYQGTGNDFVMVDNTKGKYNNLTIDQVASVCGRRFGVGADGLILIEKHPDVVFKMIYYNSDGSQSFCGNGARCAVAYAHSLGLFQNSCSFLAIDGLHEAALLKNNEVRLRMAEIKGYEVIGNDYFIHTGSPHYVHFKDENETLSIVEFGKEIRYNERFNLEGTNVNSVQVLPNKLFVETYERGVEDETLSCGTGVTAVALIDGIRNGESKGKRIIETKGGILTVDWKRSDLSFEEVYLQGPAVKVFEGVINV